MRDMQAFADVVVLAIKAALAPVQERLSSAEQKNADLQARVAELSELRDRVTVMEVKAAAPPVPVLAPEFDTKSFAEHLAVALQPVLDRVTAIEAKPEPVPVTPSPSPAEIELSLRDRTEPLTKQIAGLSERIAVLEVRAPVPGPAGADGKDGQDGTSGKDGVDGLGFDDIVAEQTDDRSFTIKAQRGDRVKEIGRARFPVQIQRGVWIEGKSYEQGDLVTWGGSQWHCDAETETKPGDGSKAWTLVVKRGRDGKDGRDAVTLPVVKV